MVKIEYLKKEKLALKIPKLTFRSSACDRSSCPYPQGTVEFSKNCVVHESLRGKSTFSHYFGQHTSSKSAPSGFPLHAIL